MREKEVEKLLVDSVRAIGGKAFKFVSPGNTGVPDRLVVFPNRPAVFVELKTDKGRLSPIQVAQQKQLRNLGQDVYTVHGVQGVAMFMAANGFASAASDIKERYDA